MHVRAQAPGSDYASPVTTAAQQPQKMIGRQGNTHAHSERTLYYPLDGRLFEPARSLARVPASEARQAVGATLCASRERSVGMCASRRNCGGVGRRNRDLCTYPP